jgi:hypothetical protein
MKSFFETGACTVKSLLLLSFSCAREWRFNLESTNAHKHDFMQNYSQKIHLLVSGKKLVMRMIATREKKHVIFITFERQQRVRGDARGKLNKISLITHFLC